MLQMVRRFVILTETDSIVDFENIKVSKSGNYTILVRYSNGETIEASHTVTVNGTTIGTINYPVTVNWDRYQWSKFTCYLKKGSQFNQVYKKCGFCRDGLYND